MTILFCVKVCHQTQDFTLFSFATDLLISSFATVELSFIKSCHVTMRVMPSIIVREIFGSIF